MGNRPFDALNAVDFVLNEVLEQIKFSDAENRDSSYFKLIELFFKGIDLKYKHISGHEDAKSPEIHIIEGVNENCI